MQIALPKPSLWTLVTGLEALDLKRLDEAIAAAAAEIDSCAGGRYHVPLASVPGVVKKTSADIAVYNLSCRRVEEIHGSRKDRYRNAVGQLELIAKGTVSLGMAELPTAADTGGAEMNRETDGNIFSRDSMEGF